MVVRTAGRERFRWSDERMFVQLVHRIELAPGASETYEMEWPNPSPGTYTARATLLADNHEVDAVVTFSVP